MPPLNSLSKLRKYFPLRKLIGAGAVLGGITIGGTTLMSGYADARERTAKADISMIGAEIEKERQGVKNDLYRNVIQREEFQRSPEIYDLERISSIGKTPGGQQSYTGLILIGVIAVAAIYLLSGVLKK